jgi:hypothetical protein
MPKYLVKSVRSVRGIATRQLAVEAEDEDAAVKLAVEEGIEDMPAEVSDYEDDDDLPADVFAEEVKSSV